MRLDKILNIASVLVLLFTLLMIFYFIFFMNSALSKHFDFFGNSNGIDNGFSIYRLGFLSLAIFITLKILMKKVDILNYPVNINDSNKFKLYREMRFMLQFLCLSCLLIVGGIIFGKLIYSIYNFNIFGLNFIIISLILVFGPLLFYTYKMSLFK